MYDRAQLSSILRRCAATSALSQGQQTHLHALISGLLPHPTLDTDLLLMYARCDRLLIARKLFDHMPQPTLHSWNILLSSYARSPLFHSSLSLLRPFLASGLRPDHFTLPSLLKSSARSRRPRAGSLLHALALLTSLHTHLIVAASILDMYAKCGRLADARNMLDELPLRDAAVWNALVAGLANAGLFAEALSLFRESRREQPGADRMAMPSALGACGRSGNLRTGKELHCMAIRFLLLEHDVAVCNALIDMYSKCGFLDVSRRLFSAMRVRSVVTWSVLISCCGVHGRGEEALRLFEEMVREGLKPNCIVFTSVLSSCNHSGLIDDAPAVFDSISGVYGLEPSVEHYACMVDLYGRHGSIEEALELIGAMEIEPTASVWGALLAACVVHHDVDVGEIAAKMLFELEPENPSNCVELCSIYERAGNWHGVAEMRRKMRALVVVKTPGCSWIEVNGKRFCFYQGDVSYSFSKRMLLVLRGLSGQL